MPGKSIKEIEIGKLQLIQIDEYDKAEQFVGHVDIVLTFEYGQRKLYFNKDYGVMCRARQKKIPGRVNGKLIGDWSEWRLEPFVGCVDISGSTDKVLKLNNEILTTYSMLCLLSK